MLCAEKSIKSKGTKLYSHWVQNKQKSKFSLKIVFRKSVKFKQNQETFYLIGSFYKIITAAPVTLLYCDMVGSRKRVDNCEMVGRRN